MSIKIIKNLHPDCYKNYFKFCIVRNPFSQLVSHYYYLQELNTNNNNNKIYEQFKENSFEYYINKLSLNFNLSHLQINGEWCLDYYIRFENLYDDLKFILNELNLKINIDNLPKLKTNINKCKDYRKMYTHKTRKKVEKLFKLQLDYFNYKF